MEFVSIVVLCAAANLDNLSAAIALGLRSFQISLRQNVVIAVVTMIGTYASIATGALLGDYTARTAANDIGAVVVMAIGLWTITHGWHQKAAAPTEAVSPLEPAATHTTPTVVTGVLAQLSFRATITLAGALAINNVASGVGAGAAGLSPLWTALVSGLVSFVFVATGGRLAGSRGPRRGVRMARLVQRRPASQRPRVSAPLSSTRSTFTNHLRQAA